MIRVYYNHKIVFVQAQLPDFTSSSNITVYEIHRYKRINFDRTIEVWARKKRDSKRLTRFRTRRSVQITLLRIIKKLERKRDTPLSAQIPDMNGKVNGSRKDVADSTEGPYLYTYPYMHADRFRSIPSVQKDDFCTTPFLRREWKFFQELESFEGLFQHMIALNSFQYWERVEDEIRDIGFHPKGFSLVEFVKWEFLRRSQGIENYSKAERTFRQFDPEILKEVFDNPKRIPSPYHASHYYNALTAEHFRSFFQSLVEECVKYKIIVPRIAIADGLIFQTWAGNFTLDRWGNPTDPQATRTVHNNKYLGKCYNAIVFYAWCGDRWLPVDVEVISGSTNENSVFQLLVEKFLERSPHKWYFFLYDAGASSTSNREYLKSEGIVPVIPARKNIKKEEIVKVGKYKYCYPSDVPEGMSLEQYKRLMNHRSQEESGFSGFTTYNNMKRMNTMGMESAIIHVLEYMCLQLLHALTAYKVNRPDLLMSYSAFSNLR